MTRVAHLGLEGLCPSSSFDSAHRESAARDCGSERYGTAASTRIDYDDVWFPNPSPGAALSHHTNLSLGCYCRDENRCHRSVLRELLMERDADVV